MSEPFLAEIRMMGFDFAPRGWAKCDGQLLPISQHQSLYMILGTTYGGNGRTTFALPDLRGRTPMHMGNNGMGPTRVQGERDGEEEHGLLVQEMPRHNHAVSGTSNTVGETIPAINMLPGQNVGAPYSTATNGTMGNMLELTGTGAGHQNMQPWLAVEFCIAIKGLFPRKN